MLHRVQVTDTSKHQLFRDCVNQALMVTLSVIYLEFKGHLISMATTPFCSNKPSNLVWAYWKYHLIFNRTMTQHTSRLCKGYFTKKGSDGVSAASDDLASITP